MVKKILFITFALLWAWVIFTIPLGIVYADGDSGAGDEQNPNTELTDVPDNASLTVNITYEWGELASKVERAEDNYLDIDSNPFVTSFEGDEVDTFTLKLPKLDYTVYDSKETKWYVMADNTKLYLDRNDVDSDRYEDDIFTLPSDFILDENITIYAQSALAVYSISYYGLPAVFDPMVTSYKKGDSIDFTTEDMTPNVYGKVFLGWYLNQERSIPFTQITPADYGDKSLWASFRPNQITIKYSGADYPDEIVEFGTTAASILASKQPSKTGYEFDGWYLNSTMTQRIGNNFYICDEDGSVMTFYAKLNKQAEPWLYYVILSFVGVTVLLTIIWWAAFRPVKEH